MAFSETIKFTALPNGVDTNKQTFSLSVLLSPELSGGSGTLQGTDFENWPNTLAGYQAGGNGFQPAQWEVTLSDGSGNVLSTQYVNLDASGTNANFWASLFPPSTTYGPPDPIQDKFRAVQIASYPAKQTTDFVNGQYQNYSPTQPPDLETVKAVYHPVINGLVGVTHQQLLARLKGERQARSRGGTIPHANDFTSASVAESFAANAYYHMPGAGSPPAPGVGTIDFHQALTFIGQHGVLQRALGLVFDLTISYGSDQTLKNLFAANNVNSDVYLSVALVAFAT